MKSKHPKSLELDDRVAVLRFGVDRTGTLGDSEVRRARMTLYLALQELSHFGRESTLN